MARNLSLETLGALHNGAFGALVDRAIADALADCDDRPGLDKARKVVLELSLKPLMADGSPGIDAVEANARVRLVLPPQETRTETMAARVDPKGAVTALMNDRQGGIFEEGA